MRKCLAYIIGMVVLVLAGCEHKELCYDHSHLITLNVAFDWQLAPQASPKKMSFYLFPKGKGEGWHYEFSGNRGGTVRIPADEYDLLCLNSDSEVAMYRNVNRWDTYEVTTHSTSVLALLAGVRSTDGPRAEGTENERVAFPPDSLWCSSLGAFPMALEDEGKTVTLQPGNAVKNYRVMIRSVANLKYLSECSATLSGMSGGLLVASRTPSEEVVTIPFGLTPQIEEGLITGEFSTFGHCPSSDGNKHHLVVYVIMKGGEKVYYTFDVTEEMHRAAETGDMEIVIDELSLPRPIVNGGGFQPSVDTWESIDIEITM